MERWGSYTYCRVMSFKLVSRKGNLENGLLPAPLKRKAAHSTNDWQQPPGRRILLVEASLGLRKSVAAWLGVSGFQVDSAPDVHAGWESIQTNHYDLVITHHNPPQLSGLELIQRLLFEQVPVPHILLSAKLQFEEPDNIYRLKFQWFVLLLSTTILVKPFSTDELMASINTLLGKAPQLPPRAGLGARMIPDCFHDEPGNPHCIPLLLSQPAPVD
jgi:CheY-like chemotaxis protein